jgi:PAS domain-containing protein
MKMKIRAEINNILKTDTYKIFEIPVLYRDGSEHPVQLQLAPIIQKGRNKVVMALGEDITIYRQAQESLRKTHDELEIRVKERTIELEKINEVLRIQIIERKQVEEALRISEEKFAAAFRLSPEPININSIIDSRYIDVNDAWLNYSGYTREEGSHGKRRSLRRRCFGSDCAGPDGRQRHGAGNFGTGSAGPCHREQRLF